MSDRTQQAALFAEFSPATPELWRAQILQDLKAGTAAEKEELYKNKLHWLTYEGITVDPFYTQSQVAHLPRQPLHPTTGWQSRTEIVVETEQAANQLALAALQSGADAVSFNLSHKPAVQWDILLAGLNRRQTPVSFTLPAQLLAEWQQWLQADGQGSVTVNGLNLSEVQEVTLASVAGIIRATRATPGFRAVTVNGHYLHNAGASATQELAFTLAAFVEWLDGLTEAGLAADEVFRTTEFSLSVGSSYFVEIAKLRALRLLVQQVGEAYQANHTTVQLHARTARWNKFRQDAYNNMVRATLEAMAAVSGGCDILTVEPFNAHFGRADPFSHRIARNVSTILREESYLGKTADPAAGAYFIENLTYTIATEAWQLFGWVEEQGGYRAAWQRGLIQASIEKIRTQKEEAIRQGQQTLVGVNKYLPHGGEPLPAQIFEPLV